MFHRPELAAAVTMQPLERLGVDAAILFSDILVISEALGLSVCFPEGAGPQVQPAIESVEQLAALSDVSVPVSESLAYVFETIAQVKRKIDVPLIGFAGGPFTVASYLIDSLLHSGLVKTKRWMREDPHSFQRLLSKIAEVTIIYLKEQVHAGVDALQIFDSWANVLDHAQFEEFCLPWLQKIVSALKETGCPVILFCRDSSLRARELAQLQPAGISFDWHLPMQRLRKEVPEGIAVQGNFHPEFLKRPEVEIRACVHELLQAMQGQRGFIVNLGHGVMPETPVDHVRTFVDAVRTFDAARTFK
jgi:uroporphyrinogen decarboxylase